MCAWLQINVQHHLDHAALQLIVLVQLPQVPLLYKYRYCTSTATVQMLKSTTCV
jgi:hypothetical protein